MDNLSNFNKPAPEGVVEKQKAIFALGKEIEKLQKKGANSQSVREEITKLIMRRDQLKKKWGFDPTSQ